MKCSLLMVIGPVLTASALLRGFELTRPMFDKTSIHTGNTGFRPFRLFVKRQPRVSPRGQVWFICRSRGYRRSWSKTAASTALLSSKSCWN
jgi:hypothetical protein